LLKYSASCEISVEFPSESATTTTTTSSSDIIESGSQGKSSNNAGVIVGAIIGSVMGIGAVRIWINAQDVC
jgi:hypothetical protein